MASLILTRHLLRSPATYRASILAPLFHTRSMSTPTILRPSFWTSMIPKPLKERASTPRTREWNPATPYIILALLVGSQAIQILWLKQERAHSLRKAEARIGLLREVIERVQRGEQVDVEKVLGTGDEVGEREWAEVLEGVREEEVLFRSKKERRGMREAVKEEEEGKGEEVGNEKEEGMAKVESIGGVKFY